MRNVNIQTMHTDKLTIPQQDNQINQDMIKLGLFFTFYCFHDNSVFTYFINTGKKISIS